MKTITKEEIINIANDVGAFKYTNRHMTDEPAFAFHIEHLEAFVHGIIELYDNKNVVIKTVNMRKNAQPYLDQLIGNIESVLENWKGEQ